MYIANVTPETTFGAFVLISFGIIVSHLVILSRMPNDSDPENYPPHAKMLKWGLLGSVVATLVPLHVWGAYHFSFRTLLYGYAFAVVGAFYGIAAIVLLLGVMVPPIMLGHWVWEVWNEAVPVDQGVQVDGEG